MLHKSKIDLDFDIRKESIALLQVSLASSIDFSLQVKQAHWNIKGMNFIAFHKHLDELRETIDSYADMIAERIVALADDAGGTLAQVKKKTLLPDYPEKINSIPDHIEALTTAISTLGAYIRKAIDTTAEAGDLATSDLFTELTRGLDHNLWLLEAHVQ